MNWSKYRFKLDDFLPTDKEIYSHKLDLLLSPFPKKSKEMFKTGYIFAPYIEVTLSPMIIDNGNFKPSERIVSRYSEKWQTKSII